MSRNFSDNVELFIERVIELYNAKVLDGGDIGEQENHMIVFSLISLLMEIVEQLPEKMSGQDKKELVLRCGRVIVENTFEYLVNDYDKYASDIIEMFIYSFYKLLASKKITKCCF